MSREVSCTHHCGFIASPSYPIMYPDNTLAIWNIQVAENSYIRLLFYNFDVESAILDCAQDYVEVYNILRNGSKGLLGRYCQPHPPPPFLLSGNNKMVVIFGSDIKYSSPGFLALYSTEQYTLGDEAKVHISTIGKYNLFDYFLSTYLHFLTHIL